MAQRPKTARSTAKRDANGNRNTFIAAAAGGLLAIGAGITALLLRRRANPAEHAAPDLALGKPRPGAGDRVPEAFRPDPTAIPTAGERESLRPATGHAPGFAADRGSTVTEPVDAA